MKVTKSQFKQIVKEELDNVLSEGFGKAFRKFTGTSNIKDQREDEAKGELGKAAMIVLKALMRLLTDGTTPLSADWADREDVQGLDSVTAASELENVLRDPSLMDREMLGLIAKAAKMDSNDVQNALDWLNSVSREHPGLYDRILNSADDATAGTGGKRSRRAKKHQASHSR